VPLVPLGGRDFEFFAIALKLESLLYLKGLCPVSSVPLTQAVSSGDASAVKAVLASGADVNERTGGGQTPLILATIFGHTHLIPLLLDAGADPQLRDNLGLNAIDWAQRRGATEAIEVLSSKPARTSASRIESRPQTPLPRSIEPDAQKPASVSEEERSRRWLRGLKQRIAEQSQREIPDGPNIFRQQPAPPLEPQLASTEREPQPGMLSGSPESPPEISAQAPDLQPEAPVVPLVDGDERPPIFSQPQTESPVLFWTIIIITLTGSVVIGSLVATFFYRSKQVQPAVTASAPAPGAVQKGTPAVDKELEGKVVSLPIAECPLKGQEAIPGTVVVRVAIDKTGKVTEARATGGDWLLRGAATEAALKSTFSRDRLRGRATEGAITYTFGP